MSNLKLLVVAPPDHYAMRNLTQLNGLAQISVSNDEADLNKLSADADVILYSGLTGKTITFTEIWKHAPQVKWVHSLSAGVEKVLIPEFVASPVPLTNARGVFKRSLAEFAVFGMLYFYKRGRRLVENQRAHRWDNFPVDFLNGKTLGVVGYGEIGRECAILAKALGVQIHAVRRNPELSANDPILDRIFPSSELHAMLSGVDAVVAAAPLTPETRHMLSDKEFSAMKPTAIVMNVGRGPVIDENALIRALQEKRIAAAALDVFEEEPLREESPLWEMENVLISPHCTDRTQNPDWLDLSMQLFVDNFKRYVKSEPLENVVNKKAGY
jgi:phosphoglycerate dehydrogenase-like enzyme